MATQNNHSEDSNPSVTKSVPKTQESENFMHMITVLMIMFGDAREKEFTPASLNYSRSKKQREEGLKLEKDAMAYAKGWLEAHGLEKYL